MKYNIKGTKKNPAVKILPIESPQISEKDGLTIIEGYANTKNFADRYGDIPTVYKKKRSFVYKLDEFKKNPVLLIDHVNRVTEGALALNKVWIEFGAEQNYTIEELVFSAINHDLGKLGDEDNYPD